MQWTFGFRLLSPAFIGGAAPNDAAQLRIPSIKGTLRMWYRVLVGAEAAAGLLNGWPEQLTESRLFGGTAKGEGQGCMTLSFDEAPREYTERDGVLKRHLGDNLGLKYFGYSLEMGDNHRVGVPSGAEFRIRAVFPRGLDEHQEKLLLATWWLFANFGGLGTRSRRGFGALSVTDWPEDGRLLPKHPSHTVPLLPTGNGNSPKEVASELAKGLRTLMGWAKEPLLGTVDSARQPSLPSYRLVESDSTVTLWAGPQRRGWKDWKSALNAAGASMMSFRSVNSPGWPNVDGFEFSTMRALVDGRRLPHAPFRTAFGLPLTYYSRHMRLGRTLWPYVSGEKVKRMPSPLLLRPYEASGKTYIVLLRLGGQLPGRDVAVAEQSQAGYTRPFGTEVSPNILDKFLTSLPGGSERAEL